MAIQFPANLDTLTNPVASDNTVTVSHAGQHANANDAIEALEAKVGKDSSAVQTSHDYKLSEITSADKAVGKTATQDLTNKTLGAGTKVTLGSDATGDIYYRHSDGTLKRLGASEGKILKIVSGIPAWETETTVADASTTAKGVVEEATLAEIDANTAAGSTSARLFVNPSTLGKSTDGTMADNSDAKIPSQKAVKTYVDSNPIPYKNGVITRNFASASGAVNTAHGLGRAPKKVRFSAKMANNTGLLEAVSDAAYNGTTSSCVYITYNSNGAKQVAGTGSYAVYIEYGANSGDIQSAVATFDATNITLTWTKTGTTTTGNIYILWEAE